NRSRGRRQQHAPCRRPPSVERGLIADEARLAGGGVGAGAAVAQADRGDRRQSARSAYRRAGGYRRTIGADSLTWERGRLPGVRSNILLDGRKDGGVPATAGVRRRSSAPI